MFDDIFNKNENLLRKDRVDFIEKIDKLKQLEEKHYYLLLLYAAENFEKIFKKNVSLFLSYKLLCSNGGLIINLQKIEFIYTHITLYNSFNNLKKKSIVMIHKTKNKNIILMASTDKIYTGDKTAYS